MVKELFIAHLAQKLREEKYFKVISTLIPLEKSQQIPPQTDKWTFAKKR